VELEDEIANYFNMNLLTNSRDWAAILVIVKIQFTMKTLLF